MFDKAMRNILLIILFAPSMVYSSDNFNNDFEKLEEFISCTASEAQLVAKSNVHIELFGLVENYEQDSINIISWKKTGKFIVFKANFKHNRYIDMYCEDGVEVTISQKCEFLNLGYTGHPNFQK